MASLPGMRKAAAVSADAGSAARRADNALLSRGTRPTRQRRAVYAALAARLDHPTAETLHRSVRRRIPGLSLATVYTALEVLADAGLVGRVVAPDGVTHYDARIDRHDHARCLSCGRMDDLERPAGFFATESYQLSGFQATDLHIEVVGYCSACQSSGGGTSTSTQGPSRARRIAKGHRT